MASFSHVRARAEDRKGGADGLAALIPPAPDPEALRRRSDAYCLAEMTRRIFCAGFVWRVIDAKWSGFEAAFLDFDPNRLLFEGDDYWDRLTADPRIVRNGAKIAAVRKNAAFVSRIAAEHGGFGPFLAAWPSSDQAGLLHLLSKDGDRLGGATGQMFLRFVGWDGFVVTRDVAACLIEAGVEITAEAKSRADLRKIQAQFNAWAEETGLSYAQLSRICALSIGDGGRTDPDEADADE